MISKEELAEIKQRREDAFKWYKDIRTYTLGTEVIEKDVPKLFAEIERLQKLVDKADELFQEKNSRSVMIKKEFSPEWQEWEKAKAGE